jgi:biopolymer transport protein ExbD
MKIPSSHYRGDRDRDQNAMTPMIDVVFLLLVFFVVAAAGQVRESVMPTQLPDVGASIDMPPPVVEEREVWADQVWVRLFLNEQSDRTNADVNGTVYDDLSRLTAVLSALGELSVESPIILDIAGPVPWGDVIYVWDACRAAGFDSINFAADAPENATTAPDPE